MKKINVNHARIIMLTTACTVLAVLSMSFQNSFGPLVKIDALTEMSDSVPPGDHDNLAMNKQRYEALIAKMDKEILKIQEEIAHLNINKIRQDISASLRLVDTDKMRKQIKKATNNIDYQKIEKGIEAALQEMNLRNTAPAVKKSLLDAKKEIEKLNTASLKTDMEQAVTQIERSRAVIDKLNFDDLFKNTKATILKTRETLQLERTMTGGKDILINMPGNQVFGLGDNT